MTDFGGDPRLHAISHQSGEKDEINVADLSGKLADEQDAGEIKGVTIDNEDIGDQKVLGYDLASETIKYITQAPSGAAIKNVQYGEITISIEETSNTATITSVDVSKSAVLHLGNSGDGDYFRSNGLTLQITGATTVTATRGWGDPIATATVYFCVIEFLSGIEDVQHISMAVPVNESYNDYTITEVNTTKTIILPGGCLAVWQSTKLRDILPVLKLMDSTTVRATRLSDIATISIALCVLEFE